MQRCLSSRKRSVRLPQKFPSIFKSISIKPKEKDTKPTAVSKTRNSALYFASRSCYLVCQQPTYIQSVWKINKYLWGNESLLNNHRKRRARPRFACLDLLELHFNANCEHRPWHWHHMNLARKWHWQTRLDSRSVHVIRISGIMMLETRNIRGVLCN